MNTFIPRMIMMQKLLNSRDHTARERLQGITMKTPIFYSHILVKKVV